MRRRLKLATVVLLTITMAAGLREVAASPSLCRFLFYYDAVKKTDAPIRFWERLAYSLALARTPETKSTY
jgi:hypothetical protein